MPEIKQTAMAILRDELQDRMNRAVFANEFNAYKNIYNLINTELLEIEKQQIVDAVEWNYKSNMGEVYYNATFNPK